MNSGQVSDERAAFPSQYLLCNFTSPQVSSFSYLHLFTVVTVQAEVGGRRGHHSAGWPHDLGRHSSGAEATRTEQGQEEGAGGSDQSSLCRRAAAGWSPPPHCTSTQSQRHRAVRQLRGQFPSHRDLLLLPRTAFLTRGKRQTLTQQNAFFHILHGNNFATTKRN